MTILAVDNYRERLAALEASLRAAYPDEKIVAFTDPLLAVRYSFHNCVDAVFTEVDMRGMGGELLAQGVRKKNKDAEIYFIIDEEKSAGYFPELVSGCLMRPVTPSDLLRTMQASGPL